MSRREEGTAARMDVLGAEHVQHAAEITTDLDRPFQEWITESIWGSLWTRDGLDTRTRSMITIAILGALSSDELELHLRATENTGVSRQEVTEILLHVAAYAGAPAGNKAFKLAKSVLEEGPP